MKFKLTTTGYCPQCQKDTETIKLESETGKCTIYKCIECLMEPTGEVEPITPQDLTKYLKKMILIVGKNYNKTRQESS